MSDMDSEFSYRVNEISNPMIRFKITPVLAFTISHNKGYIQRLIFYEKFWILHTSVSFINDNLNFTA